MKRRTILFLSLSAFAALPALAQHPSPATAEQKLIGTWEGEYQADHGPPGGFRLVIARDTAWKVSMDFTAGGQSVPTTVRDFKVEGNNIFWTQELMGMACKAAATLTTDAIRGETNCGHAAIGYLLRKKP